jgi:TolB-like protein/DNA-binding winged helix-turn-helix (wHTH) protein
MSSSVFCANGTLDPSSPSHRLPARSYRFGNIEVDFRLAELRRSGLRLRIQDQPLHVLAALLGRPGEVVSRDELRKLLWDGETFVDFDHSLNSAVKRLRDILRDDHDHPRMIETIPRHGYRFIAPVSEITAVSPGSLAGGDDSNGPSNLMTEQARTAATTGAIRRRRAGFVSLILLVILLLSGLTALSFYELRRPSRTTPHLSKVTIAVLPLHDLSERGSGSSMAAGLTQELITQLGKVDPEEIGVLTRAPADHSSPDRNQLAAVRGHEADYLLEGSTRVQGTDIRIALQLVRASDRHLLWAESYDKVLHNSLAVQQDVAGAVTSALRAKLESRTGSEK